jgi:NADH oxidase (H2O2-forming)
LDNVMLKEVNSQRLTRLLGEEILAVEPQEHRVRLSKRTISYERLILSTGSTPQVPPLPGTKRRGNFCLKHLGDADGIRHFPAKKAVVVGSGLIGLEAAAALKKRGLSVTLIETLDRIGPRIFDPSVARYVQNILKGHGLEIRVGEYVSEVFGKTQVEAVRTSKRELKVDLVVWSVGMKPESHLARDAGLTLGKQGGISVNPFMETSHPDIFSAGDSTEFPDPLLGLARLNLFWYFGAAQGRVAGLNSVATRSQFPPTLQMSTAHLFDTTIFFVGYTGVELQDKGLAPETRDRIFEKRLLHQVFLDGRLVGLQMVNPRRHEILMATQVLRAREEYSPIPWYLKGLKLHHTAL